MDDNAYRGTFKPSSPLSDEQWPMKNETFRQNVRTPYGKAIGTTRQMNDILNSAQVQADNETAQGK